MSFAASHHVCFWHKADMHLQQKHGRSRWNIFKQRAEPRCENSILHKKSVEKKTVSIAGFFNLSFFMGHNCLWRSHAYSLGSASSQSGTLFLAGGSLFVSSRNSRGASEIKLARGSPTRETVSWSIKK